MKKIALTAVFLLCSFSAFAWTIGPMNYQGRLLDNAGIPVTATLPFKVRIYDAASGGVLKFSEQHNSVSVEDGVYSFLVSTGTNSTGAWDIALWNTPQLYMEIEANGETLSPRHLMAATPYAFQANLALTTNNALALGGKTAAEYDNILLNICAAGKGKWLDIEGKCLGVGSSLLSKLWTDIDSNAGTLQKDYMGLDLSKADLTGSTFFTAGATYWFNGADFKGTVFKDAKVTIAGFRYTNLENTVWDGVTTQDSGTALINANFTNATIKNMNLSKWNLSNATLTGLSAAYLTACPAALPAQWVCKLQHPAPAPAQYFLVGPYANLSSTSALAVQGTAGKYLDFSQYALWSTGIYLAGVQMTGVVVTQSIYFTSIAGINFSNSNFIGAYIYALPVPQYNTVGINFSNSKWENSQVWLRKDEPSDGLNFTNARFSYSKLQLPIINLTPQYEFLGFSGAVFENTTITGAGGPSLPMDGVTFNNVVLDVDANRIEIYNAKIFGGFAIDNAHNIGGYSTIETSQITSARLTGNFDSWIFLENSLYHSQLDGDFSDSNWSSNELNNMSMGHNMYNAHVANQGNYAIGYVRWFGVCPDDDMASTEGTPANGYYCNVTW